MSFLKKLGQILLKGTQVVVGLSPYFPGQAGALGRIADTLEKLTGLVVQVEAFGAALGLSGPDKLKAAVVPATQIILQSDLMLKKKIDNPVLFKSGVTKIVEGLVEILNSVKDDIEVATVVENKVP